MTQKGKGYYVQLIVTEGDIIMDEMIKGDRALNDHTKQCRVKKLNKAANTKPKSKSKHKPE